MWPTLPDGLRSVAELESLPGKKPLIKLSYRPPNYETPLMYFRTPITPNDAFFVRYHLADIPEIDAQSWKLTIGGEAVETPITLTLDALRRDFEQVSVTAVCLCAGNRRGLHDPHVPGVQWGPGAMGNATWKGVRLRDVLQKAGLKPEALEIVIDGADGPVLDKTPKFTKSIPVKRALDPNTLIAFEMNGVALPMQNGFPARLVVPGWVGTYWMKHLVSITAVTKPFDNFWMKTSYRIPLGKFPTVDRFASQETAVNTPITEIMVNSLITEPLDQEKIAKANPLVIKGLAWDGGFGIDRVELSIDGGQSWRTAQLGDDLGAFSFRPWQASIAGLKRGKLTIMARAFNRLGQSQPDRLIVNPAGYHHNVIHRVTIEIA